MVQSLILQRSIDGAAIISKCCKMIGRISRVQNNKFESKWKILKVIHFLFPNQTFLKMAGVEEVTFASEWRDLQSLRQLAVASEDRSLQPIVTTKSTSKNEEVEAIRKAGNVSFEALFETWLQLWA